MASKRVLITQLLSFCVFSVLCFMYMYKEHYWKDYV